MKRKLWFILGKVRIYFISGLLVLLGVFWTFLEFGNISDATQISHVSAKNITSDKKETKSKDHHFNLQINSEYLAMLKNKNQELVAGNNQKFGGDMSKSSINLHVEVPNATYADNNRKEYQATTKGVVKSISGNFNFNGIGTLHKIRLSNGEWIYSGMFEGNFKNRKDEETFTLTLRYNPETEESDVVFVSGLLGNTGILPFGQPFLMEEELDEIQNTVAKPVLTESGE